MTQRLCGAVLIAVAAVVIACAGNGTDGDCSGDKCDDPGSAADRECREQCGTDFACQSEWREDIALGLCTDRRADAIDTAQRGFTRDALRWQCADVAGVNTNGEDDRGQEYCEYFAVIQPPPAVEGGELPAAIDLGRREGPNGLSIELSEDQVFALEDEPDAVVGQCVFTTWHRDIDLPLPVCDPNTSCSTLAIADGTRLPSWSNGRRDLGIPLTAEFMKMKVGINANSAASGLVSSCIGKTAGGDPKDPNDPLHDHFLRACMQIIGIEWRRADPIVCSAAMRLGECGCGVDTDADGVADITRKEEIARAVVPPQPQIDDQGNEVVTLRGFPLGTWSGADQLPAGCRYVQTGDDSQTLVSCDFTASDLLSSASDPKGRCQAKYGDNVVVHVPIPADAIVCSPPSDGQYSDDCGDQPWVL